MTGYTALDLSKLRAPEVIEALDYETVLAEMKAALIALAPELAAGLEVESDPLLKVLQVCAYRETLIRARVNDASRAVMLAYATGGNLENLGALFGVARLVIDPGNPLAIPPLAPVIETDADLRRRIQLSLEGFSTAGPRGAYLFHALRDGRVKDASVVSPVPGDVVVTVLSRSGNGLAAAPLISSVSALLTAEDVRPLCDNVIVQSAVIVNYTVVAQIMVDAGPDPAVVLAEARARLADYVAAQHALGRAVRRSGLFAALHVAGVTQVTLAATGGDVETMNGLVLAFGQAWTKGKLQGEEAMQMLERGVPVWDILSKAMGKTTAEIMDMSSKGKLGRSEIQLLMDELGKRNFGAAEDMAHTWDGIISNLGDYWGRFQRMVMGAGVFDFLKQNLKGVLTFLDQAAADGRLQQWANDTATHIMWALTAIRDFAVGMRNAWRAAWPTLDFIAQSIGGWDVVGWAAAFLLFRGTLIGAALGLWRLASGAFFVARALFFLIGPLLRIAWLLAGKLIVGAVLALEWAFFAAGRAALWLGRAFMIAGRFLLANPIIAVITAIAGLAYVIYQNWDGIVGYFQTKIDAVRAAFDQGLLNGVLKLLSEFNPFKLMTDSAVGLLEYLTGWDLTEVKDHLYDAFGINLFDKGVEMILSLWEGMKAKIGEMRAWFSTQIDGITPSWMRSDIGPQGMDVGQSGSSTTGEDFGFSGEPGKELGGPVRSGQTYQVNERGVELFTPNRDGWIIPARRLAEGGRGSNGGGGGVSIGEIHIHAAPGMSAEQVAKHAVRELDRRTRDARFALNDGAAYG